MTQKTILAGCRGEGQGGGDGGGGVLQLHLPSPDGLRKSVDYSEAKVNRQDLDNSTFDSLTFRILS